MNFQREEVSPYVKTMLSDKEEQCSLLETLRPKPPYDGYGTYRTDTDVVVETQSQTQGVPPFMARLLVPRNKVSAQTRSRASTSSEKPLRKLAITLSLQLNLLILGTKVYTYLCTFSLSVLAALLDSLLDVVSQLVLNYTEKHSSLSRSSALYPAGASRLEPIGVLTCAALMGMASFEILKESVESLLYETDPGSLEWKGLVQWNSVYNMGLIVVAKVGLWMLCQKAMGVDIMEIGSKSKHRQSQGLSLAKHSIKVADPTLEALTQDHKNDCLSNIIAVLALLATLSCPRLSFLDPLGAVLISIYILHSWYETGKEQIEQLTGKCAPEDFVQELYEIASHFDERMVVDVCRAYHFGPKFLVELEVVLPGHTVLLESHDLGMELQYLIEGREEVERCFVHMDYERRLYDEHVVSKVPEWRLHVYGKLAHNQNLPSSRKSRDVGKPFTRIEK